MAFVIAEPCIGTKDTACVEVCPVDCIHPSKSESQYSEVAQLYIDPDECIDCGACEAECPVEAIFPEDEVPDMWKAYIEKHYELYRLYADEDDAQCGQPGR